MPPQYPLKELLEIKSYISYMCGNQHLTKSLLCVWWDESGVPWVQKLELLITRLIKEQLDFQPSRFNTHINKCHDFIIPAKPIWFCFCDYPGDAQRQFLALCSGIHMWCWVFALGSWTPQSKANCLTSCTIHLPNLFIRTFWVHSSQN